MCLKIATQREENICSFQVCVKFYQGLGCKENLTKLKYKKLSKEHFLEQSYHN